MEDITLLTGAQIISDSLGLKLESITLSQLGKAERTIVDCNITTIVYGLGNKTELKNKIKQIKETM